MQSRGRVPLSTSKPLPLTQSMSNPWSLVRLCGSRSPRYFGNTAFPIVLPHNSHLHITAEMLSTTFPQVITHEKVLVDCDSEFEEFVKTMDILGPKLGPMVFQFPLFDRWKYPKQESFLAVLIPFLNKLPSDHKFVVEIRNEKWLDARFADALRKHNVALALTDTSFVSRPWEMKEKFDLITADFAYVRWLGDRKGIEEVTKTWDKTVVDRRED